jgi:hypothetical protein
MTQEEFEAALDGRRLWIREWEGLRARWYLVRRNGVTKTWKKDGSKWTVPIKWKLKSTARVTEKTGLDDWFKANPGPDGPLVGAELVT